jgi:hypothetical protein
MGGPVCNYLLQDNLMAPGERTTRRVIKKFGVELHLGCSEDAIRHNVLQYKEVLIEAVQKLNLPQGEKVLAELAEDETGVETAVEENYRIQYAQCQEIRPYITYVYGNI